MMRPFQLALRIGCPVLAVEELCANCNEPLERRYLELLRCGQKRLALPLAARCRELVQGYSGIETLNDRSGVYALASHSWSDGTKKGSVRWIVEREKNHCVAPEMRQAELDAKQCVTGWFSEQNIPISLDDRSLFIEKFVVDAESHSDREFGSSAGLALSLAAAYAVMGDATKSASIAVAATGRIEGNDVRAIDDLIPKLEGLVREAPWIKTVYIPRGNERELIENKFPTISIVRVSTVSEALTHAVHTCLDSLTAEKLLSIAESLERSGQYDNAATLLDRVFISDVHHARNTDDEYRVEIKARSLMALLSCHLGRPDQAEAHFRELDSMKQSLSSDRREQLFEEYTTFARLVSTEASASIDRLEPEKGAALCQSIERDVRRLDSISKVMILGTWARCKLAMNDIDGALELIQRQLKVSLPASAKREVPQCYCNLAQALIAKATRHGFTDENLLAIDKALDHADSANRQIQDGTTRENNQSYIDFWRVRRYALTGEIDKARTLAGEVPMHNPAQCNFPTLYRHRFVGEAYAVAGRIPEAISYLCLAGSLIRPSMGPFLQLILSTSYARAFELAYEHKLSDEGKRFLQKFNEYLILVGNVKLPKIDGKNLGENKRLLHEIWELLPY